MFSVNLDKQPADNPGFKQMFAADALTLGVFFPIEAFELDEPRMRGQIELARQAEDAGFAALWFRDVPLRDPNFGDVGQIYDPWVYMGYVLAQTSRIALASGSIILPLRHPIHTAKAAASVDQLSQGRLVLGIASGDRPIEFPAFGKSLERRDEEFRENFHLLNVLMRQSFPIYDSLYGHLQGADLVPKPVANGIPLMVTGNSRQSLEWIAKHSDGWITYPRRLEQQLPLAQHWRELVEQECPGAFKPFTQSYYIDLSDNPDEPAQPIHLGHRLGRNHLINHLQRLQEGGINHVILNLKYGQRAADEVMAELAEYVVPRFPAHKV